MIERLLPSTVVPVEAFTDRAGETPFPGEADLIAAAVESRRREFITARRCARDALAQLGYPPTPIRSGPRREPLWPAGIVGSITHCAGYRAAAVGRAACVASVGMDAEPHQLLPPAVLDAITAPGDAGLVAELTRTHPGVHWDRLLFSAKEAIYKAWFPLTRRWLGFEDARLSIDPVTESFTGHLLVPTEHRDGRPDLTELRGRYLISEGLVLAAVTVALPA